MGNKLGRRRQVVDEKYTRPQGLYQHKDVDQKKLRKLILDSKLAPCFPGDEETAIDLEECPICFLYYPSLNRSRCCTKGICTECFLQMKTPNSARPTQCPFCKTSNYAVEYRGVKSKEEKGMEQIEEQRVIEAKIRMRQKEVLDDQERMLKRQELSSSSRIEAPLEDEHSSVTGEEIVSSQYSSAASTIRQPVRSRQNREDEFDLDLEDIMVMEAIWLSIQDNGRQNNPAYCDGATTEHYSTEDHSDSEPMPMPQVAESSSSSSPSGGLACAIAALAERQQNSGESSVSYSGDNTTGYNMLPGGSSRFTNRSEHISDDFSPCGNTIEVVPDCGMVGTVGEREWAVDHHHGSEVAEAGTSYVSSEGGGVGGRVGALPSSEEEGEIEGEFQSVTGPSVVPESFEEQMMLAMAVSLAEARARTSTTPGGGVSWH